MASATQQQDAFPTLVIFDCDGVLVDSEAIGNRVTWEYLRELGFVLTEDELHQRFTGKSDATMKRELAAETGRNFPDNYNEEYLRRTNEAMNRELKATAHIESVLQSVPRKCVASSGLPQKIANSLRVTGLEKYFATHEVFSATMVKEGKPAPDLFLYAAKMMGVPPELCTVIEDSVPGVIAARTAGMRLFGFAGGSHIGAEDEAKLRQAGAAAIFRDMRDLPSLLLSKGDMNKGYAA